MATQTGTAPESPETARPDGPYALVAGLYVAVLVAPVAVVPLVGSTANPGVGYLGFLAVVTGVAAATGWAVSRTPGLAGDVGRRRFVPLLALVPFAWLLGAFGALDVVGDPPSGAVALAIVCAVGGTFLGLILSTMSQNRHTAAVLADARELVSWEARWPKRWRQGAVALAVVAIVAGTAGVVAEHGFGVEGASSLYLLWFAWTPFAGVANPRTFRVTDAGLVVERPLHRRVRQWAEISGYRLTADALVVRTDAWWRPAYRCDRDDVEDIETAVEAAVEALEAATSR